MHPRMSKSIWGLGSLLVATIVGASSCSSEDSEPQGGGGAGGADAQGGTGTMGGSKSSGGQSGAVAAAGATGGVTWISGGSSSGGVSFVTNTSAQGASSGQAAQSTGGAGGGVIATAGSPSTGGQSVSAAGAGGTAVNSAGAAGIAGTAGAATQDPRCAAADVTQTLIAHLMITADNECDVYVNGHAVGQTSSWSSAVTIDVSLYVHPGRKNVVAVVGRNTSSQGGNDRGIIGQLTTTAGSTVTPILVTNSDWVVSQSPGTDWNLLDYDASTWIPAAEVANAGDAPWGNVMGAGSEAKWIWFAPIPNSTAEKPNQETTYSRRVFYFDFDGHVVAAPACESPVP